MSVPRSEEVAAEELAEILPGALEEARAMRADLGADYIEVGFSTADDATFAIRVDADGVLVRLADDEWRIP